MHIKNLEPKDVTVCMENQKVNSEKRPTRYNFRIFIHRINVGTLLKLGIQTSTVTPGYIGSPYNPSASRSIHCRKPSCLNAAAVQLYSAKSMSRNGQNCPDQDQQGVQQHSLNSVPKVKDIASREQKTENITI